MNAPDDVVVSIARRTDLAAERFPDRTAVRSGDQAYRYAELIERADRLAHVLRQSGVRRESICGICMPRSADFVLAVLAVMKAGGAWLPLDPAYPASRLNFMLKDSGAGYLITDKDVDGLDLARAVRIIGFEAALSDAGSQSITLADPSPADLAYVIYTSGSTGQPKGVLVEHGALANVLASMAQTPGTDAADRWLSVTSPSFDIAILEFLLPLTVGASLVLADDDETADGRLLTKAIDRYQPTIMQATPATWKMVAASGWKGLAQLKILCGGEALPSTLAKQLLARAGSLWNLYGPTETTIWSTVTQVSESDTGDTLVPIGTSIDNTDVHVLDQTGRPVPTGRAGELYISGQGLARGYLGRPALTQARFVMLASGRAYRTGDEVRVGDDGRLEFLGRLDDQFKLHGFRIEPAEVEAVLQAHPGVRDAAVACKPITAGEGRLVGYVVPNYDRADLESRAQRINAHWRRIWNSAYEDDVDDPRDPTFNASGLRSSYDGQPIPLEELREWVNLAASRIRSLKPRRVLEFGCGTGLVLFPIAPECEEYVAVDFSDNAIKWVGERATRLGLAHLTLLHQGADAIEGIPEDHFDLVVINTVVQYFPDVAYVETVLRNAVRALRKGGAILVGDVRELASLEAFHASVIEYSARNDLTQAQLRAKLKHAAAHDSELVFDPGFFFALGHRMTDITDVQVLLKEGRFWNETNAFRYDVLLRKGGAAQPVVPDQVVSWATQSSDEPRLCRLLERTHPRSLLINRMTNRRTQEAFRLLRGITADREAEHRLQSSDSVDPHHLLKLAKKHGYNVLLLPDSANPELFSTLLLHSRSDFCPWSYKLLDGNGGRRYDRPLRAYSNEMRRFTELTQPTHADLVAELRSLTREQLPAHMCPTAFVTLSELPFTPSRKIDRQALPNPAVARPALSVDFLTPRDACEVRLARLFSEALRISPIGAHDSFFELGGDSLALVELLLAAEQEFGLEVPLTSFLDAPTVESLALLIQGGKEFRPATPVISLKSAGHRPPVFLIHGAGGLAFTLYDLGRSLGSDRPVYAIQDPACELETQPLRNVEAIASAYVQLIQKFQPDGPYYLCGHSFGGQVAYEMALQLRKRDQNVAFLGMLDTPAPEKPRHLMSAAERLRYIKRNARFYWQIVCQLGPFIKDACYLAFGSQRHFLGERKRWSSPYHTLRHVWASAIFRLFQAQAEMADVVGADSRLLMLRQPGFRRSIYLTGIHERARHRYRPKPYHGSITLFRAEEISAVTDGYADNTLGWKDLAAGGVDIHWVPGSHFTMFRKPHTQRLAESIDVALDALERRDPVTAS